MLKRLALIAVVGIIAAFGFSGTASAGNCTNIHANAPFHYVVWNGTVTLFAASVSSCTGVANVNYGYQAVNGGYALISTSVQNNPPVAVWDSAPVSGSLYQPVTSTTSTTVYYQFTGSVQCHHPFRYVNPSFSYRIQSIDPKGGLSWGSWHDVPGQWYGLEAC